MKVIRQGDDYILDSLSFVSMCESMAFAIKPMRKKITELDAMIESIGKHSYVLTELLRTKQHLSKCVNVLEVLLADQSEKQKQKTERENNEQY